MQGAEISTLEDQSHLLYLINFQNIYYYIYIV